MQVLAIPKISLRLTAFKSGMRQICRQHMKHMNALSSFQEKNFDFPLF